MLSVKKGGRQRGLCFGGLVHSMYKKGQFLGVLVLKLNKTDRQEKGNLKKC